MKIVDDRGTEELDAESWGYYCRAGGWEYVAK